jgi:sulfide dehydrogenase (flavoprotein) subunit SudA (EC 1.97.-.-)/sulfide dehydrogenase (flavoprotein) subunit SudB (EC 1.97.-.-)
MALDPQFLKDERSKEWRVALREKIKNKDRGLIERVKMPELEPEVRVRYQDREVNRGLTLEQAVKEATRCMDCVTPTCIEGCPVSINIPKFIKYIERGDVLMAATTLKETNALPAVCGRVCPQEKQCESRCFYVEKMAKPAVSIGHLERFAADYERNAGTTNIPETAEPNGIKVATVGSGPAALSFAGDMVKYGYDVTVFEALHEIGGVLKYGIPEFRLPNAIVDFELENLRQNGGKVRNQFYCWSYCFVRRSERGRFSGFLCWERSRAAPFHGYSGRKLQRDLLIERIPDPREPDGGFY